MKKIIAGKRYDTDTATLIASYNNGLNESDLDHIFEELYMTKKGQWFMRAQGGAMTLYGIIVGNEERGSKDLILCSEQDALVWLDEHQDLCDFDAVIEEYFKDYNIEEG